MLDCYYPGWQLEDTPRSKEQNNPERETFHSPLFLRVMLFHHYSGYGHYAEDPAHSPSMAVEDVYDKAVGLGLLKRGNVPKENQCDKQCHPVRYVLTDLGSEYVRRLLTVKIPTPNANN